jgi:UDP-galactopyranose mutase
MSCDVLVVGMGFAGCVSARILAEAGLQVHLIDKRPHLGGNAYDCFDENGVLIHPYGPHIFHTNSEKVFAFLSRFTDWRRYEHRVLAKVGNALLPIPINRTTLNLLYGLDLDEAGAKKFFESVAVKIPGAAKNSEELVLSSVGRDLCEKFFRGYTRKQWGLDLSELSAGVAARIPTRTNDDDRYFGDTFQVMPVRGYTEMFKAMLKHSSIRWETGVDYFENRARLPARHTIYCGTIDSYFEYRFGKLPYRSLRFEHTHHPDVEQFQPVGTVNFPNDFEYTRITEFKHLTGQKTGGTSIVKEYAAAEGEPFYPIPRPENDALYRQYAGLAGLEKNVTFVGRLAQYRYYNMDQVTAAAMTSADELATELRP